MEDHRGSLEGVKFPYENIAARVMLLTCVGLSFLLKFNCFISCLEGSQVPGQSSPMTELLCFPDCQDI